MNIPQVQIQQGMSRIGLEISKGSWSIQQPRPSLNMEQEKGTLEIEKSQASLDIDSRRAWSAVGKARLEELTDRIAQSSLGSSMQNIADIVQAGNRMMACHQKGNAFAEIARQNAFRDRPIEICGQAGYDNVDITYIPATVDINFIPGGVQIHPEVKKPSIDYYPGKVNPYLMQKNYIFMSATGKQLDAVV